VPLHHFFSLPATNEHEQELSKNTHLMKHFGWAYQLSLCIPQRVVSWLHPITHVLFKMQNSIAKQIQQCITADHADSGVKAPDSGDAPTIFHDLLHNSRLPSHELSQPRLTEEGITIIGAGTVTTAHTLTTMIYHILSKPTIEARLRADLATAPSPPTWHQLEQLPYLSAIISEGLRLSYGVSHRLQRISPDLPLHYGDWTIPPGTPVSMTQMFIHDDASIFALPKRFLPERWLGEMEGQDPAQLRRFLVPFSRGTRQCVGINLAYAELYLALGKVFGLGGVEMALFETGKEDVEVVHDFFNPCARLDGNGVRVLVLGEA